MNEKKVTIITVACLAVIVLLGGGLIYYLNFVILEDRRKELTQVKGQVADAQHKVSQIPQLKAQIKARQEEAAEKSKRIPNLTRDEYDTFANLLDDLRRRSGVAVSRGGWMQGTKPISGTVRPTKSIPPTVHKVQYELAVTGSFYQLLRYLNLIEQQSRFINVESFSVGKSSAAEQPTAAGAPPGPVTAPKREMKLTLFSYTYRPTDQAATSELPPQKFGRSTDIPD
jgi:Tfp pilus assembly protein PilO